MTCFASCVRHGSDESPCPKKWKFLVFDEGERSELRYRVDVFSKGTCAAEDRMVRGLTVTQRMHLREAAGRGSASRAVSDMLLEGYESAHIPDKHFVRRARWRLGR